MTNNFDQARAWIAAASGANSVKPKAEVICETQGWGDLRHGVSINDNPLCLNGQVYERGLGTHTYSEILVKLPAPGRSFHAVVGLDDNEKTREGTNAANLVFSVETGDAALWTSDPLTRGDALEVRVDLHGARTFRLKAREVHNGLRFAHADWADARVIMEDGTTLWLSKSFAERRVPDGPPISFTYGGRPSSELLPTWQRTHVALQTNDGNVLHRSTYQDPETGLQCVVEMMEFADFPAAEWVVRYKNTGTKDTPILENVQALNMVWVCAADEIILHRSRGSQCQVDDFLYTQEYLYRKETTPEFQSVSMVSTGGRPSNKWLPFFNLQTGNEGFIAAIGWTGEWTGEFQCTGPSQVAVRAGMDKTHLKLLPGEEIRTPRILLLFWQGKALQGNNALRQFILKYHTPQVDGKPAAVPLCAATWGGMKTDSHLKLIQTLREHQLGLDCYWVDAGWYGVDQTECPDVWQGDWGSQAGNWNINTFRHPGGLRPIGEAAKNAGMKFLLWFELERAVPGTQIPREHPDWYLGSDPLLLNLGNPDARQWATDTISRFVTEQGIDWYRQDFNLDPLDIWRAADAPDRQGITEIRYVEGLYLFLDELCARHPHLLIDNCASGGRRLDLEMIGRSIGLWRSDYQCFENANPNGSQVETMGLSYWLPATACGNSWTPAGDTYGYRSSLSPGISDQSFIYETLLPNEEYPWEWHRQRVAEQKRVQPAFYGDFHPLTPSSASPEVWMAYALHRPDLGEGFVAAFRRERSPFATAFFALDWLTPTATYLLEDADTGQTWAASGSDLAEKGLSLALDQPRASKLIFYRVAGE